MPHFKCVACKTRMSGAASPQGVVADPCPQCGSLLEPVGELTEIVGYRMITPRAGDWADDGGGLQAEAVALPRPETES
jgi:hypothetical protein